MLKTVISINRGDRYPTGVSYPVIDLAIDGLIEGDDLHELDPTHFPGKQLTSQRQSPVARGFSVWCGWSPT
jgi:hypothetical protein